LNNGEYLTVSD